MPNDEVIPERLLAHYPPAQITPAEFEKFAVELISAGNPGLNDFRMQTHEAIEGVDGTYDFDATVRFRTLGMDFLIVVEAKQHANPIKRELVQVLHSKAVSVGAQKAVLVASARCQHGAINFAKTHGVALVLVTEGRFTFETKSADRRPALSREQAAAFGIPPLVGACFGPGDTDDALRITSVSPDRPDLVQEAIFGLDPEV